MWPAVVVVACNQYFRKCLKNCYQEISDFNTRRNTSEVYFRRQVLRVQAVENYSVLYIAEIFTN